MESVKSETPYEILESELDVTDALTTILTMDWQAFTWKLSDGSTSILVRGFAKPKETPEDVSPLSSSEKVDNLGELSWISPRSLD